MYPLMLTAPVRGIFKHLAQNYVGTSFVEVKIVFEKEHVGFTADVYHRSRFFAQHVATISVNDNSLARATTTNLTLLSDQKLDEIVQDSTPQFYKNRR